MTSQLRVENPDSIEMTLTVTMSLGDWRKIKEQLENRWPASDLRYAIADMVRKADVHFTPDTPQENL